MRNSNKDIELLLQSYKREIKDMGNFVKYIVFILICSFLIIPHPIFSQNTNEAIEPTVEGPGVLDLLEGDSLDAWKIPSSHWYMKGESIVGDTGGKKLKIAEWLYTKQEFGDFEFTCELKLTGDDHRNSGIYYRVQTFLFDKNKNREPYEAPSGYEFDIAFHVPGKKNFQGTLGDWYARPSLRVFPDQKIISLAYKPNEWNRMTLRARNNRLEYWVNGIKVMDYLDEDPKASRKGLIGFQLHNGSVMKIAYRNIRVLPLEQ